MPLKSLDKIGLHIFVVLFCFLSLILQLNHFASDPGLGWHLKTGEYILENFKIPNKDLFLFSNIQNEWIVDQWFSDVLYWFLYSLGGWSLLYVFLIVYFLTSFTYVLYKYLIKFSNSYLLSALVTLFAFKCSEVHFICRPVLLGFLFFLITYFELYKYSVAEKNINFRKQAILIFMIYVLWVNTHPSFVLGFVLFVFAFCDKFIQYLQGKNKLYFAQLKSITLLGIMAFAATIFNPFHIKLHYSVIWLSQSKFAMQAYQEWQAPPLAGTFGFLLFLPIAIVSLYLIINLLKKQNKEKINFYLISSFIFFLYYGITIVRFFPYYGIIASLTLVLYLKSILQIFRIEKCQKNKLIRLLVDSFSNLEKREKNSSGGSFVLVFILVVLIIYQVPFGRVLFFKGDFGPTKDYYPYEAMEYLLSKNKQIRLLNSQNFGGFITLYGQDRVKAYIDDRTSLLKDEYYFNIEKKLTPSNIWQFAKELKADYILLEYDPMYQELINFFKKNYFELVRVVDDRSLLLELPKNNEEFN